MDVTAMLPRHRSRAERVRRQARRKGMVLSRRARREASAHPRAAAAGAVGVVSACAAAVALARRSHNGGAPASPEPDAPNQGATGATAGAGFEPHR